MRVIVCGSRTFADQRIMRAVLDGLNPDVVIQGGARGADTFAGRWADDRGAGHIPCPADWETHGKAAGTIRNQQMLNNNRPVDLVVAFVDKPLAESRGTADMVRRARKANVPTYVVEAS